MTEALLKQLILSMREEQNHRLAFKRAWAQETFDLLKRLIYQVFGNHTEYEVHIRDSVVMQSISQPAIKSLSIRFSEDRTKLEFDAYEGFVGVRKCQWYEYYQEMAMMVDIAEVLASA